MFDSLLKAKWGLTGDGKKILSPIWIGVKGKKIEYICEKAPYENAEKEVFNLGEVTLTPGFLNLHDHVSRKYLRDSSSKLSFSQLSKIFMAEDTHYLLLHSLKNIQEMFSEGITYIRDFGLAGNTSIFLRRAVKEGLFDGPEISTCCKPICMTGGHTYRLAHEADGPYEVVKAVREELRNGADVIKFMASGGLEHFPEEDPNIFEFTEEELRFGIETAHTAGVQTSAHAYPTGAILNAVRAGIDVVEHCVFINDRVVEEMLKRKTSLVPTMTGLRGAALKRENTAGDEALKEELWNRILTPHEISVKKALEAGLLVGTGTDTAGRLSDEIKMIAKIGNLDPIQAIAHPTSISAKIIGRDDIGILEKGKKANISAFQSDLTSSLEGIGQSFAVWKEGKLVYKKGER